jgi:endoglucanase
MNRRQTLLALAGTAASGCARAETTSGPFPMRRGVNLGNALDAPTEGEWGYRIRIEHIEALAAAGFDGIRLPVRWDTHMDAAGRVNADYFSRVDEIVDAAIANNLVVQLDVHHYERMLTAPEDETPRFLALWRQIAEHYADAPPALIFEPHNEPNGDYWTAGRVRRLQQNALAEIRLSNPTRLVVLGGPNWNSIDGLLRWTPPEDAHIAATAHYYEPFDFTHQNADWLGEGAPNFGREWGNENDFRQMHAHISSAAEWAQRRGIALQIGEFGVNAALPLAQRAIWTYAMRTICEELGLGWCIWGFASNFPIFDVEAGVFIPEMQRALLEPAAR